MAFTTFVRRVTYKTCGPLLASSAVAIYFHRFNVKNENASQCESAPSSSNRLAELPPPQPKPNAIILNEQDSSFEQGMQSGLEGDYEGLFPLRQLWVPKLPYPLWDKNWDGRHPVSSNDEEEDRQFQRSLRKNGVTRHIILVRHGQYDETHKEDEKRILTPLGIEQAHFTGKRIAEMMNGAEGKFGPCNIRTMRVSGLTRARETAAIIATHLPGVTLEESDTMLNEGRPCHTIPGGAVTTKDIETTDAHHPRIETAFMKYFYRAPIPDMESPSTDEPEPEKHEFEIIVCHANVIRYYLCRALQLPPEAWLRYCPFNCSLTYITIRPTGSVSCRMVGDIGHLPYNASTFSGHHGYNW